MTAVPNTNPAPFSFLPAFDIVSGVPQGGPLKLFSLVALLGFTSCVFAQEAAVPDIPFDSVPNLLKLPADLYLGEASGVVKV